MRDSGRAARKTKLLWDNVAEKGAQRFEIARCRTEIGTCATRRRGSGASCSGRWSFIVLLQGRKVPWPGVPKASQRAGAPPPVGRRAAEARARRNLDPPIAELSRARIAGGQSELDARPEGNFSWLQGLEKSRNAERISRSARGRGRPSEHLRRAQLRGLPRRLPKPKPLPGLDEERRRRYGASGRPFVPGAARAKAMCYFFCDFT